MDEQIRQAQRLLERSGIDPIAKLLAADVNIQHYIQSCWTHIKNRKIRKWTTNDTRRVLFKDLDDGHLLNILGCFDRGTDGLSRTFQDKDITYTRLCLEAYYRELDYVGKSAGGNHIYNPFQRVREYLS